VLLLSEESGGPPERVLGWLVRLGEESLGGNEKPTILYLRSRCRGCGKLYGSVLYGWDDARFLAASMVAALRKTRCPTCNQTLEPVLLGCLYTATKPDSSKTVVACLSEGEDLVVKEVKGRSDVRRGDLSPKPPTLREAMELAETLQGVLWFL